VQPRSACGTSATFTRRGLMSGSGLLGHRRVARLCRRLTQSGHDGHFVGQPIGKRASLGAERTAVRCEGSPARKPRRSTLTRPGHGVGPNTLRVQLVQPPSSYGQMNLQRPNRPRRQKQFGRMGAAHPVAKAGTATTTCCWTQTHSSGPHTHVAFAGWPAKRIPVAKTELAKIVLITLEPPTDLRTTSDLTHTSDWSP